MPLYAVGDRCDDIQCICNRRFADRLAGACIAMARVMAFVWMEAEHGRLNRSRRTYRFEVAADAVHYLGLFRLEFAR